MYRSGKLLLLTIAALLIYGGQGKALAVQPTPESHLIFTTQSDGTLAIYAIEPPNESTLMYKFSSEFAFQYDEQDNIWTIKRPGLIVASPDNQLVAFTAVNNQKFSLFIVNLRSSQLDQISLSAFLQADWSPDGTALYLSCCELDHNSDATNMIYDLKIQQLFQIPKTIQSEIGSRPQWLADGSGLIFSNYSQEFILMSRHADTTRILTNYRSIPSNVYPSNCDLMWSSTQLRFFYDVGCVGGGDDSEELIFTFDLDGNNRQLMPSNLSSSFSDETEVSIFGLETSPLYQGVLVKMYSQGTGDLKDNQIWRILHINLSGKMSVLFETHSYENVFDAIISPDGSKMLFRVKGRSARTDGILAIVDLTNGQVILDSTTITTQRACDARWLDDQNIIYSVDTSGTCYALTTTQPISLSTLNIPHQFIASVKSIPAGKTLILAPLKIRRYGD